MNPQQRAHEALGMWLGLLGVAIFAVTLPMTRLATGTADAPQLSPWFVTFGRAALAGLLSIAFLALTRSRWPAASERTPLALAVLGNTLGFPLCLGFALRVVTSGHAAVFTALLPLATAALAAWALHQRARMGFWISAVCTVPINMARASVLNGLTCCWWAPCCPGRWAMCTVPKSPPHWAQNA